MNNRNNFNKKWEVDRLRVEKIYDWQGKLLDISYYVGDRRVYLTNWFKKEAKRQGVSL